MNTHYHFIGIGGIGMGAIASLLLDKGYTVSGSDVKESNITVLLKKRGAKVFVGHKHENIGQAQVIVVSSAIHKDNPEIIAATAKNLPIVKRARLLADLMKEQCAITIAGAHGKTTTSSMVAELLLKAGLEPTTAVGGIVQGGATNAHLGKGKYFVSEVDESDGSFLYFHPYFSIITNIDREHLDFYNRWEDILAAYEEFISNTHPEGTIIACGEDPTLMNLLKKFKGKFLTYGFDGAANIVAVNVKMGKLISTFDCYENQKLLGKVEIKIPGRHNILNALATIAMGQLLAVPFPVIAESLREFKGVQRRFHQKGLINDILVVDDYGHHPTEIKATLSAAQNVKSKRLLVAFQPHRYSRLKFLMNEFAESLIDCDMLFLTDVYAASEAPIEGVNSQVLLEKIKALSKIPAVYVKKDDLLDEIKGHLKPGDLVLTLGAGDITKISDLLVEKLKQGNLTQQNV